MPVRNAAALTLVEVMVSILVSGLILGSLSAPMAVGVINRRQAQELTRATNLAQAELENIRGHWTDPTEATVPAGSERKTVGQQRFDDNQIPVVWQVVRTGTPCAGPGGTVNAYPSADASLTYNDATNKLLSNPAQVAPNHALIPASVRTLSIDLDGDCQRDYWGQILMGNAPDNTGTARLENTKRVVVRLFRRQTNLTSLAYTPVNALRPHLYGVGSTQQGGVSMQDLPLVVLSADITRP
jgi:type II secretory pathway pseudopilin PulG